MATSKRTALPKQAEEPADFAEVVEEPADFKDEVPPVAAVKREPLVVTVQSGDTWGRLAAAYGVSASDLAAANGMTIQSYLYAGRALTIP